MTQRRVVLAVIAVGTLALLGGFGVLAYRRVAGVDRATRQRPAELRQQIAALEAERTALRATLDALAANSPLLNAQAGAPVRVVVPTGIIRALVDRVAHEVADRIVVHVADVKVRRTGDVRRRILLGTYDLRIAIERVTATMKAGTPTLTFGDNRIRAAVPVRLDAGTGRATVQFTWDGRSVAGAVCGDMTVVETVTGRVVPRTYPVSGALQLEMRDNALLLRPRLPRLTLHVDIEPSAESWAAVQKVLDGKRGLCGVILDRVDVLGAVRRVIEKGFDVRVPTERARPFALPVGLAPTLTVRGTPVALAIRIAELSLDGDALWLGASITVGAPAAAGAPPARSVPTPSAPPSRSRPPS